MSYIGRPLGYVASLRSSSERRAASIVSLEHRKDRWSENMENSWTVESLLECSVVIDPTGGISLPGRCTPAMEATATRQLNLTVLSKCYMTVYAVDRSGELREVLLEIC